MRFGHDHTASATAEYIVVEAATGSDLGRRALRIAMTVALRVVSVRDAILCIVGYRVGRELLVALLQRRTAR